MRYRRIYHAIKSIKKGMRTKEIENLLSPFKCQYLGKGFHKRAFIVKSNKKEFVLKIGNRIKEDYNIYLDLKHNRKVKYAKIYWHTDRCLLQKKCEDVELSKECLKDFKTEAKKYGYIDVKQDNLGMVNDTITAFDLNPRAKS